MVYHSGPCTGVDVIPSSYQIIIDKIPAVGVGVAPFHEWLPRT